MKLSDMIVSSILKKGILWEARLVDVEFDIPQTPTSEGAPVELIKIRVKADHMSIQIEKEEGKTGT